MEDQLILSQLIKERQELKKYRNKNYILKKIIFILIMFLLFNIYYLYDYRKLISYDDREELIKYFYMIIMMRMEKVLKK